MKLSMTGEKEFSLTSLKGTPLILYFYPRDNTSGCAQEGQDFSAQYRALLKEGFALYGVSGDSLSSHEKFKSKYSFPFELVSDPDWKLCHKFAVIKMKTLYGRKYEGIERSTFVLSKTGKILREWRGVKVKGHVEEVVEFIRSLQ